LVVVGRNALCRSFGKQLRCAFDATRNGVKGLFLGHATALGKPAA